LADEDARIAKARARGSRVLTGAWEKGDFLNWGGRFANNNPTGGTS
jgi:hypothetical protein